MPSQFTVRGVACLAAAVPTLALLAPASAVAVPDRGVMFDAPGVVARFGTSPDLNCRAVRRGDRDGVFFGEYGCGTYIATDDALYGPPDTPGDTPVEAAVTRLIPEGQERRGEGTPDNPYVVVTRARAGDLTLEQKDQMVMGSARITTQITVTNNGARARAVTLFRVADCNDRGSDEGYGEIGDLDGGGGAIGNRVATCIAASDGDAVRFFVDRNSGSPAVIEGEHGDVWSRVASFAPGGARRGFDNTCRCTERLDNMVGVQWSFTVAPGDRGGVAMTMDLSPLARPGLLTGVPFTGREGARPYVALGDSYSSGEGAGVPRTNHGYDYIDGSANHGNKCHRSHYAYPRLVSRFYGVDPNRDLDFRACSGARIAHLFTPNGADYGNEPPQAEAIGVDTRLATMTIGGNDAAFSKVITACIVSFPDVWRGCDVTQEPGAIESLERLEGSGDGALVTAYAAVKARLRPTAPLVVLGYPDFVPFRGGCWAAERFTINESRWLSEKVKRLNRAIARRAADAGAIFVDVNRPYASESSPHRVCARDEWVNQLVGNSDPIVNDNESFHPNRKGQLGFHTAIVGRFAEVRPRMIRPMQVDAALGDQFPENPTLVVRKGQPADISVQVEVGKNTVVSLQTGDAPIEVAVVDSASAPVRRLRPREWGSGYSVTQVAAGTTAVRLEALSPGAYTVRVSLAPDAASDVAYISYLESMVDAQNSPPSMVLRARVWADGTLAASQSASDQDGDVFTYTWDLGDGTTATTRTVRHRFPRPGRYRVVGTARDSANAGYTVTRVVDTRPQRWATLQGRRTPRGAILTVRCLPIAVEICEGYITLSYRVSGRPRSRIFQLGMRRGRYQRVWAALPVGARRVRAVARVADAATRPVQVIRLETRLGRS